MALPVSLHLPVPLQVCIAMMCSSAKRVGVVGSSHYRTVRPFVGNDLYDDGGDDGDDGGDDDHDHDSVEIAGGYRAVNHASHAAALAPASHPERSLLLTLLVTSE